MSDAPPLLPPQFADRFQLTIGEAAEALSYSRSTVYRKLSAGELASVGTGRLRRIAVADILAWMRRNRQEAA